VTRATPADRDRVVDTVVAAFVADPAFRYFFPDDATYAVHAAVFARHLFDKRVGQDTVWLVDGGAAVSLWDPPGAPASDLALALPDDVLGRLADYEAAVHGSMPTEPHWYLGVLATHPDHAGKRWGRLAVAAGLASADRAGLPTYLETTNPENVELYGRTGFVVSTHLAADPPRLGIESWIMVRSPR
jgi:GNAT superfamily N-acetyltransferase